MRHITLLVILTFRLFLNLPVLAETANEYSKASQQAPFTFMNHVPAKVKLNDKIDLSFFVNQSVVFQYRFRIEGPAPVTTATGNPVANSWSAWINSDINEVNISKFEKEGQYRLRIEYKTHFSNEGKIFIKAFEVYSEKPELSENEITAKKDETKVNETTKVDESIKSNASNGDNAVISSNTTDNSAIISTGSSENVKNSDGSEQAENANNNVTDNGGADLKTNDSIGGKPDTESVDYNTLLVKSISDGDKNLFITCLNNGANINVIGANGGNLFHMINGKLADEDIVLMLKQKGISLNKTDNFGNTPLHLAVLRNNPLLVRVLINSGSDINLAGQGGYTPLHMASELNNLEIAKELLTHGAETNIKTFQNLSPVLIARIQDNKEMEKLIKRDGRYSYVKSVPSVISTSLEEIPEGGFNLQYSGVLLKKRQTNELIQKITAPLVVTGIAAASYFAITANTSYSNYHEAGTEDAAWNFYQKTKRYDRYTMVAASVSLISVYGFVQSTIRKHKISERLRKSF